MKKTVAVSGIAVAAALGVWLALRDGRQQEDRSEESEATPRLIGGAGEAKGGLAKAREQIDAAAASISNRTGRAANRVRIARPADIESTWVDEDGKPWPEEQKELMRTIVKAAESEDFQALAALSAEVAGCANPELRENFVDELGWFGEQAFVELTSFLSDPAEDVADTARTHIVDAFQEIESDAEKAALISVLARGVTDADLLESLSDELFAMDEAIALQTIVDAIDEGTPKAKKAARAAYEMITDEKWTDIESAEAWLAENYVEKDEADDDDAASATDKTATTAARSGRKSGRKRADADAVPEDAPEEVPDDAIPDDDIPPDGDDDGDSDDGDDGDSDDGDDGDTEIIEGEDKEEEAAPENEE